MNSFRTFELISMARTILFRPCSDIVNSVLLGVATAQSRDMFFSG